MKEKVFIKALAFKVDTRMDYTRKGILKLMTLWFFTYLSDYVDHKVSLILCYDA